LVENRTLEDQYEKTVSEFCDRVLGYGVLTDSSQVVGEFGFFIGGNGRAVVYPNEFVDRRISCQLLRCLGIDV
jgi:hypothetical protein